MTKINYISDLHIEFIKHKNYEKMFQFKPGDILCLAGDIGYPQDDKYKEFLKYCSKIFKYVILITGNHEYYMKYSIEETNKLISNIVSEYNNIIFLNNTSHYFEEYDLYILGTTLWSNTQDLNEEDVVNYNDFHRIRNMNIKYMNELHDCSKIFIETELNKLKNSNSRSKVIVMTHHLPSYLMIHDKYKGHSLSPLFANHMDSIFDNYNIDWWICGHSHSSMNKTIGKTTVLLNPVGYPGENYKVKYDSHFFI